MPMKNPPHPGKVVRVSCLEPLGLNVTEGAKILGVSRQTLSNLLNCHARMSADMAIRPRESLRLYDGDLDTAASSLRCRSGASARG